MITITYTYTQGEHYPYSHIGVHVTDRCGAFLFFEFCGVVKQCASNIIEFHITTPLDSGTYTLDIFTSDGVILYGYIDTITYNIQNPPCAL